MWSQQPSQYRREPNIKEERSFKIKQKIQSDQNDIVLLISSSKQVENRFITVSCDFFIFVRKHRCVYLVADPGFGQFLL